MKQRRKNPNFAIVKIPESADVISFYQLLHENGFNEVSFVNEVRENAFLPHSGLDMANAPRAQSPANQAKLPESTKFSANIKAELVEEQNNEAKKIITSNDDDTTVRSRQVSVRSDALADVSKSPTVTISVRPTIDSIINGNFLNTTYDSDGFKIDSLSHTAIRPSKKVESFPSGSGTPTNALTWPANESNENLGKAIRHNTQKLISVPTTGTSRNSLNFKLPSVDANLLTSGARANAINGRATSSTTAHSQKSAELLSASSAMFGGGFMSTGPNSSVDEDGNVYATCLLCQNRIMSTRLSNLTNHVRRHAAMKQYQCTQCTYSHNEQAKVRLHMNHNHQEYGTQPVDRLCFEMQLQWSVLMDQCFPEHAKVGTPHVLRIYRSKDSEILKATVGTQNSASMNRLNDDGVEKASVSKTHVCGECGEVVASEELLAHLRDRHQPATAELACSECGYRSVGQRSLSSHINAQHPNSTNVHIETLALEPNELLKRFFPDVQDFKTKRIFDGPNESPKNEDTETATCRLCRNTVPKNSLALLVHAKHHSSAKQFHCTDCTYQSMGRKSMHAHIQLHHKSQDEPINVINEEMKNQWMIIMKRCFPNFRYEIESYNFTDYELETDISSLRNTHDKPPAAQGTVGPRLTITDNGIDALCRTNSQKTLKSQHAKAKNIKRRIRRSAAINFTNEGSNSLKRSSSNTSYDIDTYSVSPQFNEENMESETSSCSSSPPILLCHEKDGAKAKNNPDLTDNRDYKQRDYSSPKGYHTENANDSKLSNTTNVETSVQITPNKSKRTAGTAFGQKSSKKPSNKTTKTDAYNSGTLEPEDDEDSENEHLLKTVTKKEEYL